MTLKSAFDIGRKQVRVSPNMNPAEADKLLLLPEDASHDLAVFPDLPVRIPRRIIAIFLRTRV